jgi:hypothetical protein
LTFIYFRYKSACWGVTWISQWIMYTTQHLWLQKQLPMSPAQTQYHITEIFNALIIHKIWGFHGGDYEECHLLECYTM